MSAMTRDTEPSGTFNSSATAWASDVRMFSFGPIKTATALGGGVLLVRDAALLTRLRARHAAWPVQRTGEFFRRVAKFAFFHPLLSPWPYGTLVRVLGWLGRDHDKLVTQLGRGFVGGHFFTRLRRQPCAPLVALLERRLATSGDWPRKYSVASVMVASQKANGRASERPKPETS